MEIRVLKYFLTVAREGNITRAAELLHITQPTLSRQLMQLEDELGAVLFIRGKRKMVLTEEGMVLKRRAEEIIILSEKAELEVGSQSHDISGEIAIGCGVTEATQTMGKLIKKFSEIYPHVSFRIRNGNSDFILENIDNASLAKKEYITSKDLIDLPLIASARSEAQTIFSNWYGTGYENLSFCATSDLTTTAAILVKNDVGYAVVVEGSICDAASDELCFRPLYPSLNSHSLFVWKKYQSFSLTVTKFIDFISKEIKKL